MGCFCKQAITAMQEDTPDEGPTEAQDQATPRRQDQTLTAIGNWLAARWLPAPPWRPDTDWLTIELPDAPMQPAAFTVLSGLIEGQKACQADLALDPTQPGDVAKLARIVTTLNRRMTDLDAIVENDAPWEQVAALNDQVDLVTQSIAQGVLAPPPEQEESQPLSAWRPLLTKVKALAPLMSLLRTLQLDPVDGSAVGRLADRVRTLRAVSLPKLDDPLTVFRLISRYSAISRIQASLGADPRRVPFRRVQRAVQARVDAVLQHMPERVRLVDGQLVGMPSVPPNPSQLLTGDSIALARSIPPELLDRLRWQVPAFDQLDMLTTVVPVAKLVGLLRILRIDPVRSFPCDGGCDAGPTRTAEPATGSRGSGTDAARAR